MKHVFILGEQRIDQKSKKGLVEMLGEMRKERREDREREQREDRETKRQFEEEGLRDPPHFRIF